MTLSPEKITEIKTLFAGGYNKTQISKKLKISLTSVKQVIGENENMNIEQTAQPANTQNTAITPQQSNAPADNIVKVDPKPIIYKLVNNMPLLDEEAAIIKDILVHTPNGYDLILKTAISESLTDPLKKSFVTHAMQVFDDIIKDGIRLHYLKEHYSYYLIPNRTDLIDYIGMLLKESIEHKERAEAQAEVNKMQDIKELISTIASVEEKEQDREIMNTIILMKVLGK